MTHGVVVAAPSALLALLSLLLVTPARADVRLEGEWPDAEVPVSLEARRTPRSEAVRRLADAMGWSVILHAPTTDPVDLHVKEQHASQVLSMLLSDHDYVAKRDGTIINIARAESTPAPPAPPSPSASEPAHAVPPAPLPPRGNGHAPDRVVSAGNARVEKSEVVRNVVVFGGAADVYGKATGDVTVIGGAARVHEGAHVMGDATAVGGSLSIDDGATVDGDVGVVGGSLHRGKYARIGGDQRTDEGQVANHDQPQASQATTALVSDAAASVGRAIAGSALLFVFGAMLMAFGSRRMETLQTEFATRPMRTFGLGVVGAIVFTLLVVAVTLTIIGIPVAIIAALIAVVAAYSGVCAVLTSAGAAILRRRTSNPYVHLALGCTLFLVATAMPLVGNFVFLAVLLLGVGTMVATRGAGLLRRKRAVPLPTQV